MGLILESAFVWRRLQISSVKNSRVALLRDGPPMIESRAWRETPDALRLARRSNRCTVLGPGVRAVLWVQGCPLRCPGCVAPETLPFAGGEVVQVSRLAEEINERMEMISSDLDRFINRQPPDLEVDAALERNFAAMHELDAVMRQRCRNYPAQLAGWEAVMEYLEEVETRFKAGVEAEDVEPAN